MLVGTAITGAEVRPVTTLANAPSMPATTRTTSAVAIRSCSSSTRCSPATPTSATTSVSWPYAVSTAVASRATGRSLVPAVSTSAPRPVAGSVPQVSVLSGVPDSSVPAEVVTEPGHRPEAAAA